MGIIHRKCVFLIFLDFRYFFDFFGIFKDFLFQFTAAGPVADYNGFCC